MVEPPCRVIVSVTFVNGCNMHGMHLTEVPCAHAAMMARESLHLWVLAGTGGGCSIAHLCRDLFLLLFCGTGVGVLLCLRSLDLNKRCKQAAQLLAFPPLRVWGDLDLEEVCQQGSGEVL